MSDRTTVMYYYDGTYNGFLSCVFESFAEKETPAAILPVDEADQTCLFGAKYIETDLRRAERVRFLPVCPKRNCVCWNSCGWGTRSGAACAGD